MKTALPWILVIVAVVSFGVYFYPKLVVRDQMHAGEPVACTADAMLCLDGTYVGRSGPDCEFVCPDPQFAWTFTHAPEVDGVPKSLVTLSVGGVAYAFGPFDGSCSEIGGVSAWPKLEGEYSGVVCWFAGGGIELGVFDDHDSLVLKQGVLEEGNEEVPGSRAGFETIIDITNKKDLRNE